MADRIFKLFGKDDVKHNRLPAGFPNVVGLDEVGNLNPKYRRWDEKNGNKEFEYFCERILSRLRPIQTRFRVRKEEDLLSTIFTPSDEAFALMIIYNEKDRWDSKPETENTTIDPTSEPLTKKKNGTIQ